MLQRLTGMTLVVVLLSALLPSVAVTGEPNNVEIIFARYESTGTALLYDIFFSAAKEGATTCEIVTPLSTYQLFDVGGEFWPGEDFQNDHWGISFDALAAAISGDWTLTWDAAHPSTRTVAVLNFGSVPESDFLLVPTLTAPVDQGIIEANPPTIEWTYGETLPCNAQPADIEVSVTDQPVEDGGTGWGNDEFSCSDTSWTVPQVLPAGTWYFRVANTRDYRNVPDGITIVEGSWTIQNLGWIALQSVDRAQGEIPSVSAESRSWGAIKTLYRK